MPLRRAGALGGLCALAAGVLATGPQGTVLDDTPVALVPEGYAELLRAKLTTPWRLTTAAAATAAEYRSTSVLVPDFQMLLNTSDLEALLAQLPRGALLQLAMTGFDTLDLSAIPPRFAVCNVHNAGTAIAEYVLAAMLSWNVRLPQLDAEFRRCTWHGERASCTRPPMHREAKGQTVGILGYGTIGEAVAQRAAALGMRAIAVSHHVPAKLPAPLAWFGNDTMLPQLANESDFIVVCLPLTSETRGFFGRNALAVMKPTGVLINVARGPIVDEAGLFDALSQGRIGGAVLDVWWNEHFEAGSADDWPSKYNFSALPNVWMTPHTSYNTAEAMETGLKEVASNLDAVARGTPLQNVIRPAVPPLVAGNVDINI